ncbi:uncharacterized protein HKW66_Vig0148970 [Vigna angularis]|uniref:Uncharacterized protein n=1 Tax=Phaseolus angularis TaxID=3914 RepID=A0A8T0JUH9_PHAAN|nr:uncharacterized protein HKW66_Vig0148970 [Vigna angularis]
MKRLYVEISRTDVLVTVDLWLEAKTAGSSTFVASNPASTTKATSSFVEHGACTSNTKLGNAPTLEPKTPSVKRQLQPLFFILFSFKLHLQPSSSYGISYFIVRIDVRKLHDLDWNYNRQRVKKILYRQSFQIVALL